MLMSAADYRESLRKLHPVVYVYGRRIESVADEPLLAPGVNSKRIEVARFIKDLTASYLAGWYSVISLHGGGSPEAMKLEIYRNYPIDSKVDLVERLLDRGVLADATRTITRNRQPGKCCAVGCFAPDAPQMVALPRPSAKAAVIAKTGPKTVAAD